LTCGNYGDLRTLQKLFQNSYTRRLIGARAMRVCYNLPFFCWNLYGVWLW